mmetsp:Transcript_29340/g.75646  ORF Transcript_29340/g.75646 Transcript_29340/m.75646 type:complete len:278 (+) Transcript_29340:783-1616(+)
MRLRRPSEVLRSFGLSRAWFKAADGSDTASRTPSGMCASGGASQPSGAPRRPEAYATSSLAEATTGLGRYASVTARRRKASTVSVSKSRRASLIEPGWKAQPPVATVIARSSLPMTRLFEGTPMTTASTTMPSRCSAALTTCACACEPLSSPSERTSTRLITPWAGATCSVSQKAWSSRRAASSASYSLVWPDALTRSTAALNDSKASVSLRSHLTSEPKVVSPMTCGRSYAIERLANPAKSCFTVSMRESGMRAAAPRPVSTSRSVALTRVGPSLL